MAGYCPWCSAGGKNSTLHPWSIHVFVFFNTKVFFFFFMSWEKTGDMRRSLLLWGWELGQEGWTTRRLSQSFLQLQTHNRLRQNSGVRPQSERVFALYSWHFWRSISSKFEWNYVKKNSGGKNCLFFLKGQNKDCKIQLLEICNSCNQPHGHGGAGQTAWGTKQAPRDF